MSFGGGGLSRAARWMCFPHKRKLTLACAGLGRGRSGERGCPMLVLVPRLSFCGQGSARSQDFYLAKGQGGQGTREGHGPCPTSPHALRCLSKACFSLPQGTQDACDPLPPRPRNPPGV